DERQHRIHRWMTEAAARVWLDRHARADDRPRLPENVDDAFGIETTTGNLEETPLTVEGIGTRGECLCPQFRGRPTVEGGAADVQRLGHRAEAHTDAGRHTGGDADRMRKLSAVELQKLCGCRRRAESADGARGVKSLFVVRWIDRVGDLALDLESNH